MRVEGLEFIAVGTCTTEDESRTAVGRIREDDTVIGINQHGHVGAMQFDLATGDSGRLATDTTRSITIARTIVLGGTEVIDHHIATSIVATRVTILALEEHHLTHRAVDSLNPYEVFKDRRSGHTGCHVDHVLGEPSDVLRLRDTTTDNALIRRTTLGSVLQDIGGIVQSEEESLFLIVTHVTYFTHGLQCVLELSFQKFEVFGCKHSHTDFSFVISFHR